MNYQVLEVVRETEMVAVDLEGQVMGVVREKDSVLRMMPDI